MMKILINYHQLITATLLTIVVLMFTFVRLKKPWKYFWWLGWFFTPLIFAVALQLYFNSPENYPEGLCLREETDRIDRAERELALKKLKVQEDILRTRVPPSLRDESEMRRIKEDRRNLLLDTQAEEQSIKTPRIREIKIISQKSKKGNAYVALLENKELQWGRDFKLRFESEVSYETMDCSADLKAALKAAR